MARPVKNSGYARSVILELEKLEPGDYVVLVRIDIHELYASVCYYLLARSCSFFLTDNQDWYSSESQKWYKRKVTRQKAERAIAYSIAASTSNPSCYLLQILTCPLYCQISNHSTIKIIALQRLSYADYPLIANIGTTQTIFLSLSRSLQIEMSLMWGLNSSNRSVKSI